MTDLLDHDPDAPTTPRLGPAARRPRPPGRARRPARRRLPHRRQPARRAAAGGHARRARARRLRRRGPRRRARRAGRRRSARGCCAAPARLDDVARQLDEYFAGRRRTLRRARRPAPGPRASAAPCSSTSARSPTARPRATRRWPGPPGPRTRCAPPAAACCHQPGARRRAVPPRGAQRRHDRAVPRRRRGQADAAGPGGGMRRRSPPSTGSRVAGDARRRSACARRRPGARRRRVRGDSPSCTTTTPASARRSTWPATASAQGQYRYFARPAARRGGRAAGRVLAAPAADRPRLGRARRPGRRRGPTSSTTGSTMCHAAGQSRPTPLLLRYGAGDWNALHRDLYGDLVFPLQVVVGLDAPGVRLHGRRVRRRRAASPGPVAGHDARRSAHGEALVFTTRDRPVRSARGWAAAPDAPRRQRRCVAATAAPSASIFHDATDLEAHH